MIHYIIWFFVVSLYTPVFYSLYSFRWDKVDYTHAYFILPISIWLAWRKRSELRDLFENQSDGNKFFSFILLTAGLLMFVFGWREDYLFVTTLSIFPVLSGLILYLYGAAILKCMSFPILYLFLLVPPPFAIIDGITLPMRYGTSFAAAEVLRFLNYPVTREGLLLTIGYNDIFMGEPCSGFRSLITMSSLVLVYVYISTGTIAKKLILSALIVPFTLIGNLIRVITLCLITYYFGEEAGQGFFHNFSGIVVFIIAILGIIGIESLTDKLFAPEQQPRHNE